MSARITVPIGDVAGVVREALRAALDARGITLVYRPQTERLTSDDIEHTLHELGKVAARAVASLDVDKLAPGEDVR